MKQERWERYLLRFWTEIPCILRYVVIHTWLNSRTYDGHANYTHSCSNVRVTRTQWLWLGRDRFDQKRADASTSFGAVRPRFWTHPVNVRVKTVLCSISLLAVRSHVSRAYTCISLLVTSRYNDYKRLLLVKAGYR